MMTITSWSAHPTRGLVDRGFQLLDPLGRFADGARLLGRRGLLHRSGRPGGDWVRLVKVGWLRLRSLKVGEG